jgi:hypothetical protein
LRTDLPASSLPGHGKLAANNLLVALFMALNFHGTYNAFAGGPLAVIGLWPLVVAAIPMLALLRPRLLAFDHRALLCAPVFIAILLGLPRSPQLSYSISISMVAFFNLFFLVSISAREIDFPRLRRSFYMAASYISVASIVLFVVMFPIAMAHIGSEGYRPGFGVLLDRGVLPRAAGFNGDSNFFAILLGLAAIARFEEGRRVGPRWGIYAILIALLCTMSRSAIAGLVLCYTLFYFRTRHVLRVVAGGALVLAMAPVFFDPDVLATIVERRIHGALGQESRLNLWLPKLERYEMSWFGNGLNVMKADSGTFSHNTFLDVIIELGIFGMIIFAVFLLGSLVLAAKSSRYALACFTFILLMLPFFSLLYSPLLTLPLLLSKERRSPAAPYRQTDERYFQDS